MFCSWFTVNKREPCAYKFLVEDIAESTQPSLSDPNDSILKDFSLSLLTAHADPERIKQDCSVLLKDLDEVSLPDLKQKLEKDIFQKYVKKEVFPVQTKGIKGLAWFGNFGEVLSSLILMKFKGFSMPIQKLRYREKQSWAMKMTDFCLIKKSGTSKTSVNPLVCYGEVKTRSSNCNPNLGIEGHDSLVKDDALQNPEILKFYSTILFNNRQYEESEFFSKLKLGKVAYDKQYYLFLVHEKNTWRDEILEKLNDHPLDSHLENFCVSVVLNSAAKRGYRSVL